MYKTGHAYTYLFRLRRLAVRVSDLCGVRPVPVCCEPRHRRVEASSVSHVSTLKAYILNITYDCYCQNNNVKMATLQI